MNNTTMTKLAEETNEQVEDEISLLDIVRFFIDNKVFIGITTALSGLMGLIIGFWLPAQYEATMNIQMAMVANSPIESPGVVLEKMKLPLYFSSSTWEVCDTDQEMTPSRTLAKKLIPILNKNAPFIGLSYRGDSQEAAKKCLQAVLEDVRNKQSILSEPIIRQKQVYLAALKEKLTAAEQAAKIFSSQKQDLQFKDDKFSPNALILAARLSMDNEIKDLRNQIVDLEISLSAPQTQETYLAAPLFASPQKVSPSRSLILAIALLGGFMLGIFGVLMRKTWATLKSQLHTST
jgi:capsular polysaccharide biosynthesis protein